MSESSHNTESWLDHWWPLLVIAFGLLFVTLLLTFQPGDHGSQGGSGARMELPAAVGVPGASPLG